MPTELGELAYPFGSGGFDDSCDCKYACFPQLGANFDAVIASRNKGNNAEEPDTAIVFTEFSDVSDPPRKFRQKDTTWRCYSNISDTTSSTERTVWDWNPDTKEWEATTTGDGFMGCDAASETPEVTTTNTTRRTIYTETNEDDLVLSRLEVIEVLSKEYTTPQMIADAIADIPDWDDFPDEPPDSGDGIVTFFVSSGICYGPGDALWNTGASRLILVGAWALADDEMVFTVQRVRYRLAFPKLLGDASTFTVEWEEVFVPEDSDSEDDWEILSNNSCSGDASDAVSDILNMVEKRSNGEVFARNARYTALG